MKTSSAEKTRLDPLKLMEPGVFIAMISVVVVWLGLVEEGDTMLAKIGKIAEVLRMGLHLETSKSVFSQRKSTQAYTRNPDIPPHPCGRLLY